jgi:pimeloyl-ACP methyl ester carboxylesterase
MDLRALMPFYREVGSGSGIVCLHASASHSAQWRMLMERLAPKFRVLAADSYGAGKSPAWPTDRRVSLRDEVSLLEPVFDRAGERFTLVGHSYGAAVALIAAVDQPDRVRGLAMYEPTLFSVLDAEIPPPNDADEFRKAVAATIAALATEGRTAAAQCFIDYWMGGGAWASMPESRREAIAASIVNVEGWFDAITHEQTPLSAFKALDIPVLCMMGTESPVSSRAVARVLASELPRVKMIELQGVGHMGPVTHPEIVNEVIAEFVDRR